MGKLLPFKARKTPMQRRMDELVKHYVVSLFSKDGSKVITMTWWDNDNVGHVSKWDRETEEEIK